MSTSLLQLAPLAGLVVFVLWRISVRRRQPRTPTAPGAPGAATKGWDALVGVLAALTLLNR